MTQDASPPPETGLCASCQHTREIVSGKGSRFYYCGRSEADVDYPKYPRLPVHECPGYQSNTGQQAETQSGR